MPTFNNSRQRFFFIHIPRTAGRHFYELIKSNGFEQEENENDIVISHYDREFYEKCLNIKYLPHISIIRNPIDRFFGSSFLLRKTYGKNIDFMLENINDFYTLLDNFWVGDSLNGTLSTDPIDNMVKWFRPQSDYISPDTKIWKYEDGFDENFADWISEILKINFKINDVTYPKLKINENDKVDRNARLIDNIKEYYKHDIHKYYYEHT